MNQPIVPGRVSIVTPCYNAAEFVAQTIESVTAQAYGDIEHIVVDDASTDASWAVIEHVGNRIQAVRQPRNAGGAAARNHGAALATGEYLMFLDADDLLGPDAVEGLVTTLRARPASLAACSWQRLIQRDGDWTTEPAERPLPARDADQLLEWLLGRWVPPCAVLWPRAVFDATGGWDETLTLNDDGDLMMRALLRGVTIEIAERGTASYRTHGDRRLSVSRNVFEERHLRSQLRVFTKLALALDAAGRLDRYRIAIGTSIQGLALTCHQLGAIDLGRECASFGQALAGRRAVSRTMPGRLLTWLLGMERKERLLRRLAMMGLMTRERRRFSSLEQIHGDRP
jgi:glycosyltransferase involved in cell wall biosynthesis